MNPLASLRQSLTARALALGLAAASFAGAHSARAADPSELAARVDNLPAATPAEQVKKAALAAALRQAGNAALNRPPARDTLLAEIERACGADPAPFTATSPETTHIAVVRPIPAPSGNPYLDRVVAGARTELATPLTSGSASPDNYTNARETAWRMESYWWLYANPASPLHGRAEVIGRLLDLALGYIDAINTSGASTRHGAAFFDDFAIGPASAVLREIPARYPGLLLPEQKTAWDAAMRFSGNQILRAAADRKGDYANIDVAIGCELLNFGLYLKDEAMLEKARFLIHAQDKNRLGGGGFHYIWNQNESAGYHGTVVDFLARYHEITGDATAADLIRSSEWHGPGMGRIIDFWTCPSWKHTWNQNVGTPTGREPVIALTKNPYVRGLVDPAKASQGKWFSQIRPALWYTPGVEPKPMPDRYTIADPDTEGVRAWYGTFTYATTLREIPETEPGHTTLVGGMVTTPDFRLKQALFGVCPRVRIKSQPSSGADYSPQAWAWLTSGLRPARIAARHASVTAGAYRLHAFGSSRKGPMSDWAGAQLWIGLPDRLVGIAEVRPSGTSAQAYEVNGVIRFGFGGTALGEKAELRPEGDGRFRYGDWTAVIHRSTFASTQPETVPFRRPQAPVSEIVLRDERSAESGGRIDYPGDRPYAFVAEIRAGSGPDATVEQLPGPDRLFGLRVQLGEKTYVAWFNAGETPQSVEIAAPAGTSSLWRSGDAARPTREGIKTVEIPPGAACLLVGSPDDADHLPGWKSFEAMVAPTAVSR
jgi:hypothetical protein